MLTGSADIQTVDSVDLLRLCDEAQSSPRKRAHLLLHRDHSDEVQRFLVAMYPGSYIRAHRHPEQWEMLTLLGGSAEAITFGSQGELLRRCLMQQGCVVQIAQGVWHTVVATAPRTLLLEVKPGPFRPADFAGWAPEEGVPAAQDLLERLQGDL